MLLNAVIPVPMMVRLVWIVKEKPSAKPNMQLLIVMLGTDKDPVLHSVRRHSCWSPRPRSIRVGRIAPS